MSLPTIAFVGTGRMGANMARRLHESGYTVAAVFDAHAPIAADLAKELGAKHATSLAETTASADIIITVITDDAAQLNVFAEEGDSLLTGAKGKTFINCATLSPKTHIEVARRASEVGADTLEACMASSITQARAGTLYLMCAGNRAVYDRVSPVLQKLGEAPRYIGETGTAAQLKALVNMVMNINTAALAEGLGLASSLGLDLDLVREVFSQTGANSRVLVTDSDDMAKREHECYFSAAHAAKDSGIAWALGVESGLNLPLSAATKLQYERMVTLGLGDIDKSGISELTFKDRAW